MPAAGLPEQPPKLVVISGVSKSEFGMVRPDAQSNAELNSVTTATLKRRITDVPTPGKLLPSHSENPGPKKYCAKYLAKYCTKYPLPAAARIDASQLQSEPRPVRERSPGKLSI